MSFFHLLFPDRNTYIKWADSERSDLNQINRDINLTAITEEIKKIDSTFPDQFILYPYYNPGVTRMRSETMSELYKNPAACDEFKEIISELTLLKKSREAIKEAEHAEQKQQYFLVGAVQYCVCVEKLEEISSQLKSPAFSAMHDWIMAIAKSVGFIKMRDEAQRLKKALDESLNFTLTFDFNNKALRLDNPGDGGIYKRLDSLCKEILGIQIKYDYSIVNSNPISAFEEQIVEVLKLRYPDLFTGLAEFYENYSNLDFYELIDLKPQIQFYLDYIDFVLLYEKRGFHFTAPVYNESSKNIKAKGIYDISLAIKLGSADKVVSNDTELKAGEIFVLTGPNQGGKTTFIRSLAQNILLAQCGCFVGAEYFEVPFYDKILTHFNREETLGHGGRLEEELERIKKILAALNSNSFVLFNECFASTRRKDGVILSQKLLDKLLIKKCTGGYVTHYNEIPENDRRLKSLVAGIESKGDIDDVRTYKISESQPMKLAYARSIAQSCKVTYEQLMEVIKKSE